MRGFPRRGGPKGATGPPSMHLPPYVYQLFQMNRVVEFKPKIHKNNYQKPVSGIAAYVKHFEPVNSDTKKVENPEKYTGVRKRVELKKAKEEARDRANREKLIQQKKEYDPYKTSKEHPEAYSKSAYKTLFVARLDESTTESSLTKLFEEYGPIKNVFLVKDKEGKPKGYAFIEFENEQDMTLAYRRANGIKVEGKRILVDVERGRTVKGWYPRRLGGGLGGDSRRDKRSGMNDRGRDDRGYRRSSSYGRRDSGRRDGYDKRDDRRGGNRDERRGFEDRRDKDRDSRRW